MAGDWDRALTSFLAAGEGCEAVYGRYLARLMMIYADYGNLFFSDRIEPDYNRRHLLRDPVEPGKPGFLYGHQHFNCLARADYRESPATPTLLEQDLRRILEDGCTLAHEDGGPLPIRLVVGRCEAPLFDAVAVGVWDPVDAVAAYQLPYGAPPLTVRFQNLLNTRSSDSPCPPDDPVCGPLIIDGSSYVRLVEDSERFLSYLYKASARLFDPSRGCQGVFFRESAAQDGVPDASDRVLLRLCNADTGEPIFSLRDVHASARWTYEQAPPPTDTMPRTLQVFCGGVDPCPVLAGEIALNEPPPLEVPNRDALSPDGTRIARLDRNGEGEQHIYLSGLPFGPDGHQTGGRVKADFCVTCGVLPGGIITANPALVNMGRLPQWIPDPRDPDRPPLGLLYMNLDHPSGWGWQGECQGMQFYAVRPDGTGNSALLPPGVPPAAFNYQAHVSPDGGALLWTSTWHPETGAVGAHTMLMADILFDERADRFRLENIHSVLPSQDHGWYEAQHFSPDYPRDRKIFFTSTAHSMQSPRGFSGVLGPDGIARTFYKLTWPEDDPPAPFRVDRHPGWYEHFKSVDHGKQVIWISSDTSALAAERYDWFLDFPPWMEGSLLSYTVFQIRHVGLGLMGYLSPPYFPLPALGPDGQTLHFWISDIDGGNREVLAASAEAEGWRTVSLGIQNGDVYLAQSRGSRSRIAVIRFR